MRPQVFLLLLLKQNSDSNACVYFLIPFQTHTDLAAASAACKEVRGNMGRGQAPQYLAALAISVRLLSTDASCTIRP